MLSATTHLLGSPRRRQVARAVGAAAPQGCQTQAPGRWPTASAAATRALCSYRLALPLVNCCVVGDPEIRPHAKGAACQYWVPCASRRANQEGELLHVEMKVWAAAKYKAVDGSGTCVAFAATCKLLWSSPATAREAVVRVPKALCRHGRTMSAPRPCVPLVMPLRCLPLPGPHPTRAPLSPLGVRALLWTRPRAQVDRRSHAVRRGCVRAACTALWSRVEWGSSGRRG
jgi:hypothetical protein